MTNTNRTYIEPAATAAQRAHNLAEYRTNTTIGERRAVTRLLAAAFCKHYTISVNDGEEWTVKNSRSSDEICAALATTGEDTLAIRNRTGAYLGRIYLVWGNAEDGEELIADFSDEPEINGLVSNAH